ncbi:MAG: hypothetical protein KDA66_03600 [Planctomycetaceae bacterium]|nr:hypothetical protein [Planctomycetaceae bacterium]
MSATNDEDGKRKVEVRTWRIVLVVLLVVQYVLLLLLNMFDYGVVFPSQSGLTLGHLVFFAFSYLVAFFASVGIAIWRREYEFAVTPLAVALIGWAVGSFLSQYVPH